MKNFFSFFEAIHSNRIKSIQIFKFLFSFVCVCFSAVPISWNYCMILNRLNVIAAVAKNKIAKQLLMWECVHLKSSSVHLSHTPFQFFFVSYSVKSPRFLLQISWIYLLLLLLQKKKMKCDALVLHLIFMEIFKSQNKRSRSVVVVLNFNKYHTV